MAAEAPTLEKPRGPETERKAISPEAGRLTAGAIYPDLFHPNKTPDAQQKTRLQNEIPQLTPDKLPAHAIADLSGEDRNSDHATYEEWMTGMKHWFDQAKGEDKQKIQATFTALGIHVEGQIQKEQLDQFFDNYLDMEGSQEQRRDRYEGFVNGFVDEFVQEGNVDQKALQERLRLIQPLIVSFGKEDIGALVNAHIEAQGFALQSEDKKRQQAPGMIKTTEAPLSNPASKKGFQKLAQRLAERRRPPAPESTAERESNLGLRMGGESIPGSRGENQDSMWFDQEKGIAIVCDGIGGQGDGARASQFVRDHLQASFDKIPEHETIEKARDWVRAQILQANDALREVKKGGDNPIAKDAGTTLNLAYIWKGPNGERKILSANIGDSRLSATKPSGELIDITLDQGSQRYHLKPLAGKPGRFEVDDGHFVVDYTKLRKKEEVIALQNKFSTLEDPSELRGEEAALWRERNMILAAIEGHDINSSIEMRAYHVEPGQRFILRSDGLTDVMTNEQTKAVLASHTDPQDAADALNEAAKQADSSKRAKGYADDKSVIVIDVLPDSQAATPETGSNQLKPELAQTNPEQFKAELIKLLGRTAHGQQALQSAIDGGLLSFDKITINPDKADSLSDNKDGITLGTAPLAEDTRDQLFFEGKTFNYDEETTHKLLHEITHKLMTRFRKYPPYQDAIDALFQVRDDGEHNPTHGGFTGIGGQEVYLQQGKHVQANKDMIELTAMYLQDPNYLKRYLTYLTDLNKKDDIESRNLVLLPRQSAEALYQIIEGTVTTELGLTKPETEKEEINASQIIADAILDYKTGEVKNEKFDFSPFYTTLIKGVTETMQKEGFPKDEPVYILSELAHEMIRRFAEEANDRNAELAFTLQGVRIPRDNNNDVFVVAFAAPASDFSVHKPGEVATDPAIQKQTSTELAKRLGLKGVFQRNKTTQEGGTPTATLHVHQKQLGDQFAGRPSSGDLQTAEAHQEHREQNTTGFIPYAGIVTQTDDHLLINIIHTHRDADNKIVHDENLPYMVAEMKDETSSS